MIAHPRQRQPIERSRKFPGTARSFRRGERRGGKSSSHPNPVHRRPAQVLPFDIVRSEYALAALRRWQQLQQLFADGTLSAPRKARCTATASGPGTRSAAGQGNTGSSAAAADRETRGFLAQVDTQAFLDPRHRTAAMTLRQLLRRSANSTPGAWRASMRTACSTRVRKPAGVEARLSQCRSGLGIAHGPRELHCAAARPRRCAPAATRSAAARDKSQAEGAEPRQSKLGRPGRFPSVSCARPR